MTACDTPCPKYASAVSFIFWSTNAPTCDGEYCFPPAATHASPLDALIMSYGTSFASFCVCSSSNVLPMSRFVAYSVFVGLVTACRFAGCPTNLSPLSENATMDGVVLDPSAFSITFAFLPSMTATHELVVPRSMPITSPPLAYPLAKDGAAALNHLASVAATTESLTANLCEEKRKPPRASPHRQSFARPRASSGRLSRAAASASPRVPFSPPGSFPRPSSPSVVLAHRARAHRANHAESSSDNTHPHGRARRGRRRRSQ